MRKRSPKEKRDEIIKDTRREDATKKKGRLNEKLDSKREETQNNKGHQMRRRNKREGNTK